MKRVSVLFWAFQKSIVICFADEEVERLVGPRLVLNKASKEFEVLDAGSGWVEEGELVESVQLL